MVSWQGSNDKPRKCVESRGITLPTKVPIVKIMIFPGITHGCERWTIKKAECQRIDAFQLRFWRRLLEVLWPGRRSNQLILKEINPEYSPEYSLYFAHLMRTDNSLEKSLMLGKIEGRNRRRHQRMKWLASITDAVNMNLGKLMRWRVRESCHVTVHGITKSQI